MTYRTGRREFLGITAAAATSYFAGAGLAVGDTSTPLATNKIGAPSAAAGEVCLNHLPPYNHAYHQCLVYKIFCADKQFADPVEVTFEEALRCVRTVHDITGGLRQIVYLVGWQFDGHDSKYPAWSEVNRRLKRRQDPDALASFFWLAKEAKKYNALVSVHINMSDAYENSPLWKEYLANGLIICKRDKTPRKGSIWGGEQSYTIDKVREWESGYAKKRIDGILRLLPFLRENGTVHIDAFGMIGGDAKLRRAAYGILDYWRQQGVDVTTEYFDPETAGRVPMVYHLNLSEENRLKYPPNVICGGGDGFNQRMAKQPDSSWKNTPEAGCLYEEAWGISNDQDLRGKGSVTKGVVGTLCSRTLVWYYLNRHRALSYDDAGDTYRVTFADGVESTVKKAGRHLTVRHGERTLVDDGDIFMPALWTEGEWFAYGRKGGKQVWPLPEQWKNAKTVTAVALTDDGRGEKSILTVLNGTLSITLEAGKGLAISRRLTTPSGGYPMRRFPMDRSCLHC